MGQTRWLFHSPEQVNHKARKMVELLSTPPTMVYLPATKRKSSWVDFLVPLVAVGAVVAVWVMKY